MNDLPHRRGAHPPRRAWAARCAAAVLLASTPFDVLPAAAAKASAQRTLAPVDDAGTRADFAAFRDDLRRAVARRDAAAVIAALDPHIKLSFGGDAGLAAFRRIWKPHSRDSPLWSELGTVLALGGSLDADGTFAAPYVHSRWPDDVDPFTHVAVLGRGVRVRAQPSASAKVLARLDHAIVEVVGETRREARWVEVRLADGRTGHVDARLVRSPLERRALFARRGGHWRMTAFVAGD